MAALSSLAVLRFPLVSRRGGNWGRGVASWAPVRAHLASFHTALGSWVSSLAVRLQAFVRSLLMQFFLLLHAVLYATHAVSVPSAVHWRRAILAAWTALVHPGVHCIFAQAEGRVSGMVFLMVAHIAACRASVYLSMFSAPSSSPSGSWRRWSASDSLTWSHRALFHCGL